MLIITVPGAEVFNEVEGTFSTINDTTLELEHSLLSLSKWESEFQKPFLSKAEKSNEETLAYVRCMITTPDYDPDIIYKMSRANFAQINDYIESKQSATTFTIAPNKKGPSEIITAELIYYWMVSFKIPFETESWHLNRLFSLIRLCSIKGSKPEQMSKREISEHNRKLNEARRAELNTKG